MIARKKHSSAPALRPPASSASARGPAPSSTAVDISSSAAAAAGSAAAAAQPNWQADRPSILLLVVLYAAQGLPMGLAFGSIPFLLKESGSSYAALAKFSFASMPYTLKLLIAPIVDSYYSRAFGRRKSWIVPVQLAIGFTALVLAPRIEHWVYVADVDALTPTFLAIIAMTATQDIAVDGWSLTMLRPENVCYASTCQSLGMSLGYFSTFTIFLSLNSQSFCDGYVRRVLFFLPGSGPLLSLANALQMLGFYYIALTFYITFFKIESPPQSQKKSDADTDSQSQADDDAAASEAEPLHRSNTYVFNSIKATYRDLFVAVRLSAVKSLVFCLLIAKIGFSAYDNVAPLKLLEFGFSKEKMASMALLQAPVALLGTVMTGRWVAKKSPIQVYLWGFMLRFTLHLFGAPLVALLKHLNGVVTPWYYALIAIVSVTYHLASDCLMFVGMGAFFLRVTSSSVHVAGSYLTLLNTASNMGGLWHKAITLWLVDQLTVREACSLPVDAAKELQCPILYDGFYVLSAMLLPVSLCVGFVLFRTLPKLGKLPDSAWKASQ